MPGSSELSDALNPYYFQDTQHIQTNISPNYDQHTSIPASSPSIVPQQNPVLQPHRSELADAFNPAAVSPSTAARVTALKPCSYQDPANFRRRAPAPKGIDQIHRVLQSCRRTREETATGLGAGARNEVYCAPGGT
ncbi:hypothetical protein ACEPAF_6642 [Sanghuangporus sanghuang]